MTQPEGSQALLERLRREERAAWGVDPDGTAYLDVAERLEEVRAAYIARVAEEERDANQRPEARRTGQPEAAELV
jgi:hypothetical protein